MPGANRRLRRLKQGTELSSITGFSSVNPVEGDILIYDATDGVYENGRALTGDYSIGGQLTAIDGLFTNDVVINDALLVGGNAGVSGDLSVIGASALNGPLSASSTLAVTGATVLGSTLDVTGALSGSSISLTGNATVAGTLNVTGAISAGSLNLVDLVLSGGLTAVTVDATHGTFTGILSAVDVSAAANLSGGALGVSGTGSFGGAVDVSGTLALRGLGILSHDLTDFTIENVAAAGNLALSVTGADLVTDAAIVAYADAGVALYFNGTEALRTTINGANIGSTTANSPSLTMENASSTQVSSLAFVAATSRLVLSNEISGGNVVLQAAGGAGDSSLFTGDPDGAATLYFSGDQSAYTHSSGFTVDRGGDTNSLFLGVPFAGSKLSSTSSDNLWLSYVHGATVSISGQDTVGTEQPIFLGDPDDAVTLYHAGVERLYTTADGVAVDSGTTTHSIHLGPEGVGSIFQTTPTAIEWLSYVHGARVRIRGEDAAGVTRTIMTGDPDAGLNFNHAGTKVFGTTTVGVFIQDTSGAIPQVKLRNDAGITLSQLEHDAGIALSSLEHGSPVMLRGEDLGGTSRDILVGDPDGTTSLYYTGIDAMGTTAAGGYFRDTSGSAPSFNLRNDAGATLTQFTHNAATIITSLEHGSEVILRGEDAGGVSRDILRGDPDGNTKLYAAGEHHASITAFGLRNIGRTAADDSFMEFYDDTDTTRYAYILVSNATAQLNIVSEVHGSELRLLTEDSVGTVQEHMALGSNAVGTFIGFHNTAPVAKPTVTGSRGGNAALASVLTALANYGLITDSST